MATAALSADAMARMEEERMEMERQANARVMGLTAAIADPDGDGDFPEDNELTVGRPRAQRWHWPMVARSRLMGMN